MLSAADVQFRQFCATHPARRQRLAGGMWEYIACGQGAETLLLLPGAPGRAEGTYLTISAFEHHYRILAPSYPAHARTAAALCDGLAALLAAEGVGQAHVIGGSYSGLVAQCLLRQHPASVGHLVLQNTGVPQPERARRYARYQRLVATLPGSVLRAALMLGTLPYVRGIPHDRAFWRRYFHTLLRRLHHADFVARLAVWVDMDAHYTWQPDGGRSGAGRILILEADDDGVFPAAERAALRALYRAATVHRFSGLGHGGAIAHQAAYIARAAAFLHDAPPLR